MMFFLLLMPFWVFMFAQVFNDESCEGAGICFVGFGLSLFLTLLYQLFRLALVVVCFAGILAQGFAWLSVVLLPRILLFCRALLLLECVVLGAYGLAGPLVGCSIFKPEERVFSKSKLGAYAVVFLPEFVCFVLMVLVVCGGLCIYSVEYFGVLNFIYTLVFG